MRYQVRVRVMDHDGHAVTRYAVVDSYSETQVFPLVQTHAIATNVAHTLNREAGYIS